MSGKQVPDRMLAHAARAKGTCDDFSVCRAFWSFWAPKGHDITTTNRIYDCRLRVSCIKEYKRLFNVLSVLKRYSPYSLQVNRLSTVVESSLQTRRPMDGYEPVFRSLVKTASGCLFLYMYLLCVGTSGTVFRPWL